MSVAEISSTGVQPWLTERRYRSYHVICLLLLPGVLLAMHPDLFINPGGNGSLDPWVYTGLFLSLPEHIQRFGETYYSSRLPWVLPGFVAQKLFPPLTANYVLHLTFFYALVFAIYVLVSSGANRSVAFVAAVFATWCPPILTALSWDNPDGAGLVFLTLGLCCLEKASVTRASRRTWWSLAAGATFACLIGLNLTLVALFPAYGAFIVIRAPSARWRSATIILAIAVVGAAAMFAFLGLLNRFVGGQWFFIEPSVRFGMLIRNAPNPWKTAGFNWSRATWLALPVYAAIGAIVTLVVCRRTASPFERAVQALLSIVLATWIFLDVAADFALLQISYYTSYLAPLAVLAIATQAGPPPGGRGLRSIVWREVGTLVAVGGIHLLMFQHGSPFWRFWTTLLANTHITELTVIVTAVTTGAGLVALLALQVIRGPYLRWGIFVLGVTLSFGGMSQHWPTKNVPDGPVEFESTVKAHRFIAANIAGRAIRIWHAPATASAPPFRSIACTFLCSRVLVNEELPRLTEQEAAPITATTRLIMLVNNQDEAQGARASLRTFGLDYSVVAHEQFGPAGRTFLIIVADVVPVQRDV